jgi:hypothetical protein
MAVMKAFLAGLSGSAFDVTIASSVRAGVNMFVDAML